MNTMRWRSLSFSASWSAGPVDRGQRHGPGNIHPQLRHIRREQYPADGGQGGSAHCPDHLAALGMRGWRHGRCSGWHRCRSSG